MLFTQRISLLGMELYTSILLHFSDQNSQIATLYINNRTETNLLFADHTVAFRLQQKSPAGKYYSPDSIILADRLCSPIMGSGATTMIAHDRDIKFVLVYWKAHFIFPRVNKLYNGDWRLERRHNRSPYGYLMN